MTAHVEQLEDQLKKNSGNSSKPPSTDKAFGPKAKNRSLRRKSGKNSGGQKGRKGYTLKQVDDPDETRTHRLKRCPLTGRVLSDDDVVGEIRPPSLRYPRAEAQGDRARLSSLPRPRQFKDCARSFSCRSWRTGPVRSTLRCTLGLPQRLPTDPAGRRASPSSASISMDAPSAPRRLTVFGDPALSTWKLLKSN